MSRANARGAGRSVLWAPIAAAARLVRHAQRLLGPRSGKPDARDPPIAPGAADEPWFFESPEGDSLAPLPLTTTGIAPEGAPETARDTAEDDGEAVSRYVAAWEDDVRAGDVREAAVRYEAAWEGDVTAGGPVAGGAGGEGEQGAGGPGVGEAEVELSTRTLWRWLAGIVAATLTAIVTSLVLGWIEQVPGFRPPPRQPGAANSTAVPAPAPSPEGASPLTVAVAQWRDSGCGVPDWVFLGDESEIDFQPGADPRDPWAGHPAVEDALVASPSHVEATVQGRSETAVVLTGVEAQVHRRRPVPVGTALSNIMCGHPGAFRSLEVDLDGEPPAITSRGERDRRSGQPLMPIRFPHVVSSSDPETFLINAVTAGCDCEWTVELSWQSAGRTGTVVIDDDGRPFRTVSASRSSTICFPDGTCNPYSPAGPGGSGASGGGGGGGGGGG